MVDDRGRREVGLQQCTPLPEQVGLNHGRTSFQWGKGRPGTGERKYGIVVPSRLPRYTVCRSGPPNVTLAIHGASVPRVACMISVVMVPA